MFEHILEKKIANETVLINKNNGMVCILDEAGTVVWRKVNAEGCFDHLAATIDIDDGISEEYNKFIMMLKRFIDGVDMRKGPSLHQYFLTRNIPLAVGLEITLSCQQRCRHCYNPARNNHHLDINIIRNLTNDLEALGTPFITVTGGEPLCHPEFLEICDILGKRQFAYKIFTNGYNMTRDIAKTLKKLGCYLVGFTFFGADTKSHEFITRTPGSFRRICNAVEILKDEGVPVDITFFLMRHNFQQQDAMLRLADNLGVTPSFTFSITPRESGDLAPLNLWISEGQVKSFIRKNKIGFSECNRIDSPLCTAGRTVIAINSQAQVLPCLSLPIITGDLHYENFISIWNNSPILKEFKDADINKLSACRKCKFKNLCLRCFTGAYLENGDLWGKAPHSCMVARVLHSIRKKGGDYHASG